MPRISRDTDIYPISLRELEVLRVEDVTVSMRRITFGGPGLLAHTRDGEEVPKLVSDGFDDDIRLILPDPATGERPRPASLGDGRLDWNERVNDLFRTYTVRKWLPNAGEYGELIVDFARHGSGLAENWSAAATAGEHVYIAGPKNCGSHPSHTDWLFLVGDETALPAIARCLEEAPAGHPIIAVVEVPTQADIQQIDCAADLDLRWVVREDGGDFTDEILRLGRDGKRLPSGIPFVWAGGEAGRLKRVRAFAKQAAVPREHVEITGYWRRNEATAESAAASSADGKKAAPAGASSLAPLMQLYEMSEIAPGFALRAAAQLAIFEHIETAALAANAQNASVTEVARRLDIDPSVLLRFLRYLESLDLVSLQVPEVQPGGSQSSADAGADAGADATVDNLQNGFAAVGLTAVGPTAVSLTSLGRELADPDGPISRLNGPDAMRPLVWLNLVEGLRSAAPVTVGSSGSTWAELRQGDSAISDGLEDAEATRAQWVAPALAQEFGALVQRLSGGSAGELDPSSVAVAGAGAGTAAAVYADELLRRHPQLSVTVLDTGAGVDRVRAEVPEARRDRLRVVDWNLASSAGADSAPADILIVIDPFALAIPSEVPVLLESASRIAPTVIVISRLLAESGDEDHDYEEDITRMLLDGRSVPTARDMSAAVSAAGLIGVTDLPVGWGTHALVTRRR